MDLVIVESPTKARTLNRFLPEQDYQVVATVGHVRDLPKSKLGVDVEHDFAPEWEMVKGKIEVMRNLKADGLKAKRLLLATDPDREGEAIAWHVVDCLKSDTKFPFKKKQVLRITFHEITKQAILDAIEHASDLNGNLFNAQQARRVVDRLVGYKLSPVLWKKIRRGLSAGRVQSVAVRLIVEREREREDFKAEEFWEIATELSSQLSVVSNQKEELKPTTDNRPPTTFFAWLKMRDGEKLEVKDEKLAMEVMGDLDVGDYQVNKIEKKEMKLQSPPPFTTSTMQQKAGQKLGWSAKRTMRAAQKLYEQGLITYHRTDSLNIAETAIKSVRAFIKQEYGVNYLSDQERRFKTRSKVAQEAHEAIRPTIVERMAITNNQISNSKQIPNSKYQIQNKYRVESKEEDKLYGMIWKRFVACQMAAAVFDRTRINIVASCQFLVSSEEKRIYGLVSEGKVQKFDGWMKLYDKRKSKNEERKVEIEDQKDKKTEYRSQNTGVRIQNTEYRKQNLEEDSLPDVTENEPLQLIEVTGGQLFTEPPARYSEPTLIKKLEELGIGRPSTYATIMSTIQDRGYVEKEDKQLVPTSVGLTTNDFLVKYFPTELNYQFTAKMEDALDEIANGEQEWVPVVREFYDPFIKDVKKAEDVAREKIPTGKIGEKCPDCKEGDVVIRTGRFGKFLSCSRFPDCKYTAKYLEKIGMPCPECTSTHSTGSVQAGSVQVGEVIVKKTRKGRVFFGCSRYPDCKYASWNDPRKTTKN